MPCPYAYMIFDDVKNVEDNDKSDTIVVDRVSMGKTTVNNQHEVNKESSNYMKYLRTDVLLSALNCVSLTDPLDKNSPPVHDEHFFILIHQGNFKEKFSLK